MEWQWIITGGSILLLIGAGIFCGIREWQTRREMRALEEMLDAAIVGEFLRKIMMRHVGRRSSPGWRSI